VAVAADFDAYLLLGRAQLYFVAAHANGGDGVILGVDAFFHNFLALFQP
jgi:hypothetical protein